MLNEIFDMLFIHNITVRDNYTRYMDCELKGRSFNYADEIWQTLSLCTFL